MTIEIRTPAQKLAYVQAHIINAPIGENLPFYWILVFNDAEQKDQFVCGCMDRAEAIDKAIEVGGHIFDYAWEILRI